MAITLASVVAIERGRAERANAQMLRVAQAMSATLERSAAINSSYLSAAAALFAAKGEIDRAGFLQFAGKLEIDAKRAGTTGIGWAPLGPAVQTGASGSSQPAPIAFLFPDSAANRAATGFDLYAEPARRAAMNKALRTRRPVASGKIDIMSGENGQRARLAIFMPVFDQSGGERSLAGFVFSRFDPAEVLSASADLVDPGQFEASLFDGPASRANLLSSIRQVEDGGKSIARQVRLAGRPVTLRIAAPPAGALSTMSMFSLLFGLAVALLLMMVARLLTQQVREDQRAIDWFAEQALIRKSLTRELNHRVKNTLANILSIIALTRRGADDVDQFADGLDGRIRSLATTHDLLTRSEWGTTPIASVVAAELSPYASDGTHEVAIEGPHVELAPGDALSLGLALHELASNAVKFGALSALRGKIRVSWERVGEARVRLLWVETDGPLVPDAYARGFGIELIERIASHELEHPADIDFAEGGVRCALEVPVRRPAPFAIRSAGRSAGHSAGHAAPRGWP